MYKECMRGSFNPLDIFLVKKRLLDEFREHPYYLRTFGTCIFCGPQGSGKTLSAVQYVLKLREQYPRSILVTNVEITSAPFNTVLELYNGEPHLIFKTGEEINTQWILDHSNDEDFVPINIEYNGLDMLKYVNNAEYGVIYLIDEFHLELNSLESKNIDIDVITEISQQRKQRKHIVGTSQIFMRLAKPLREQIHDIILCKCFFGCVQWNKWINGETVREENGKIECEVNGRFLWTHKWSMYQLYDTYAKMKRYNKEWQGRPRVDNLYERSKTEYVRFVK